MRIVLLLITALLTLPAGAQQFLISTAGNNFKTTETSISWSMGELATTSYTSGELLLTEGFQQPGLEVSTLIDQTEDEVEIKAYPNPVRYQLTVDIPANDGDATLMELYDLNGRLLKVTSFKGKSERIDLSSFPSGEYILRISDGEKLLKSLKIIKH